MILQELCIMPHHFYEGLELTFSDDNTEAVLDVSVAVLLNRCNLI